jgi:molecular chaperone Hsp33
VVAAADELVRTVSADGTLAVRVIVAGGLVGEAAGRHATAPTATAALGRALMGAVLLAADAEDDETVQLQFRGNGLIRSITVIGRGDGHVRGYVGNPAAHLPPRDGKLDVGGAVGRGVLAVVRYHPAWREPYSGIVPLASGEVAEDIARYLVESEQRPSAVGLGVYVGADGVVEAAGGFLVQALPGAEEDSLGRLERNVRSLPSPTELLREGLGADDVIDRLLAGLGCRDRLRIRPAFECGCGPERIRQAVILLGRDEIREIAASGEALEIRCEFCGDRYRLPADEVGALLPDS